MRNKYFVLVLAAFLGLVAYTLLRPNSEAGSDDGPWTLEGAMAAGADYLATHIGDDGRFVYWVNLDGRKLDDDYNVVRHGGTIYGLWTYYDLSGDERVPDTMRRAARYLLKRHVQPVEGLDGARAIFSFPGEEVSGDHRVAKLGGTALGLVGLIKTRELDPEIVPLETLRDLGEFVLSMQDERGYFHSRYREQTGIDTSFVSLYYPGETILALTCLYETDPDPRWLDAALKGIDYLVKSRRETKKIPNDHWLMIAIAYVLPHYAEAREPPLSREAIVQHSLAIGRTMLDDQKRASRASGLQGSFSTDGTVTPAATRLEGLVALHAVLPPDHPARAEVRQSIEDGVAFIRQGQVFSGPHRGGFKRAVRKRKGKSSFNRRQAEVRIDYVQHALSAMAGYHRILQPETR